MASQKPVTVSKKTVENAEQTWSSFMKISKVSTYGVCLILFLMWVFFIAM